jgi:hypothetical protein
MTVYQRFMDSWHRRSMRALTSHDAASFVENSGMLRRLAGRSDGATTLMYGLLREVYFERVAAKRYDVAAAVASTMADICLPRGEPFEKHLAEARYRVAYCRHRSGEPVLEVIEEALALLGKHRPDQDPTYASALGLLAVALSENGRHDDAVDAARRALDLERALGSANLPAARLRLDEVSTAAG